jgi:hypothetical protein
MVEAMDRDLHMGFAEPVLPGGLQQVLRSHHIGLNEELGSKDGSIDMRFGREVNDGVNAILAQEAIHQDAVTDIAVRKLMLCTVWQVLQVGRAPGVSKGVEVHHPYARPRLEQVADKVASNKSRATGYENILHDQSPSGCA